MLANNFVDLCGQGAPLAAVGLFLAVCRTDGNMNQYCQPHIFWLVRSLEALPHVSFYCRVLFSAHANN